MLKRLCIKNLAIIENVDITFSSGFTVLTGSTGAGKSLVIDSLSLLLGDRASSELIRTGEEKAYILGEFIVSSSRLSSLLSTLEIPFLENRLTIERIISKSKSAIKLNGVTITLTQLLQVAPYLADIHNQFDFQKILNPDNYLSIIDGYAYELVLPYLTSYKEAYQEYLDAKSRLEELKKKKEQLDANYDYYFYQYNELKAADLYVGEEQELEDALSLLKNYDKIYSLSQEALSIIRDDALDKIYLLEKTLRKLAALQSQYEEQSNILEEKYVELEDLFNTLKKQLNDLDYDPSSFETKMQRQADLLSLQRKYRKTSDELIAYRDELASLIKNQTSIDGDILEAKNALNVKFETLQKKASSLTTLRQKVAASIETDLSKTLEELMLKNRFKIAFNPQNPVEFTSNGADIVDFLIETNIGEGLKSLAKVVSGGEASRIMLGLKTIFIKAHKVSTLILDEIDTGISGEVASCVARKIKEISYATQVIAITHLPQVASVSDHHILIEKEVREGRTYSFIKELDLDEKIVEIAHLISGNKVTDSQLAYAKEMVLSSH